MKTLPLDIELETKVVLKAVTSATRALAELKGKIQTIPNQSILINTLALQEAKESSAIENIVTTQDDLFRATVDDSFKNLAAKEVKNYARALQTGYEMVKNHAGLSSNMIIDFHAVLEPNKPGFRKVPGTTLKDSSGRVIYEPPQSAVEIIDLMHNLENYINSQYDDVDPLVKMAMIHFQFESIHPFYDGNGRTGRIINILYLVLEGLLDIPVLYLSRYIIENKSSYYSLIQKVRDEEAYEEWILWMLKGVEETAHTTIRIVNSIRDLMSHCKKDLQNKTQFYSRELLDALFIHPYTKIEFIEAALGVSRNTAAKYLNKLADIGLLSCAKLGRSKYYINNALYDLLSNDLI